MATKFERLSSGKVKITNTTSGKIVFLRSDLTEQYDHQDDAKIQLKDGVTVYAFEWINAQNSASVSLGASRNAVQLELATNYFFNNASVLVNNALDLGIIPLNSFIVGTGANPTLKTADEVKTILGGLSGNSLIYSAIELLTLTGTGTNSLFNTTALQYLGTRVIPQNVPIGTAIDVVISGRVTTSSSAGVGTLAVKIDGITMTLTVNTLTHTNSITNSLFYISFTGIVRTLTSIIFSGEIKTVSSTGVVVSRPISMTSANSLVNFASSVDSERTIDVTYTFANTGNTLYISSSTISLKTI